MLPQISNFTHFLHFLPPVDLFHHVHWIYRLYLYFLGLLSMLQLMIYFPWSPLIQKNHKFLRSNHFFDSLNDYFNHCLLDCVFIFFNDHLKCCVGCGSRTHDWFSCTSSCPDCPKDSHSHIDCPKLMLWLHDPETPHHLTWMTIVRNYLCKQENFPSFSS